mgnify:FL=1
MEFVAVGEHRETAQDILYDLSVVRCVGPVLSAGQEVLDALDVVPAPSTMGPMGTFAWSM